MVCMEEIESFLIRIAENIYYWCHTESNCQRFHLLSSRPSLDMLPHVLLLEP